MNNSEKDMIEGVAIGGSIILGAAGAAYLVLKLAEKHPGAAKTIVSIANESVNLVADNISTQPDDKLAIEAINKGKDVLAEMAKHQLDEHHKQSQQRTMQKRWWYYL